MPEDRWPKICLRKILRKERNGQPTLQEINKIFINGGIDQTSWKGS